MQYICTQKNNHSVLTNHIVELKEESLYEETKYNRSFFHWFGIVKVSNRLGLIAIYHTPHMAIIIPDRAFVDKESKKQFYAEVSRRINKA